MGIDWDVFRQADIYLIDQVLRGRIGAGQRVLDCGCGGGRNIPLLLAAGCRVTGVDPEAGSITELRRRFPAAAFHRGACPDLSAIEDQHFDVVVLNAVVHFAPDRAAWRDWCDSACQRLAPEGLFFVRCSSRLALPDARPPGFGYLADAADFAAIEARWSLTRIDPLKTVLVEELRTMSTWVTRRTEGAD